MKIMVLCGGVSPEREVSLNSGAAVAKALVESGTDAFTYDVTSIGDFIKKWDGFKADGVFIALHGGWGEDGRLQAALDAFGIPYTGSGAKASMLSMDKSAAKLCFEAAGVATPRGFVATPKDERRGLAERFLERYGKIVIKPNGGGSTVGVTITDDIKEYGAAVALACGSDKKALVEQFVEGEEATVPVTEKESGEAEALPAIHIKPKSGFYDYKNKYTAGRTEYICPSDLPRETNEKLSSLAVAAFKSLGCRAYGRVDFRITPRGDVFALEINTAPGMTATSLVPKSAKAAGLSFGCFLEKIIKQSFSIKRDEE